MPPRQRGPPPHQMPPQMHQRHNAPPQQSGVHQTIRELEYQIVKFERNGYPEMGGAGHHRHSTYNEEQQYVETLRRKLDKLLVVAEQMDQTATGATEAWESYQMMKMQNHRPPHSQQNLSRSQSLRSLNHQPMMNHGPPPGPMRGPGPGSNYGPPPPQHFQNGGPPHPNYHHQGPPPRMGGPPPNRLPHQRPPPHGGPPHGPGGGPQQAYANVMFDNSRGWNVPNFDVAPGPVSRRDPRWEPKKRAENKRPPNQLDIGRQQRGGIIPADELQRKVEQHHVEKQNAQIMQQRIQQYEHQALLFRQHQLKAESPLQSIGRPGQPNAQQLGGPLHHQGGAENGAMGPIRMPFPHLLHPHLMQQQGHPHMHPHQQQHLHHGGVPAHLRHQFFDDHRLGTLSEPGNHFADLSDVKSEIGNASLQKNSAFAKAKALSLSTPDLSGNAMFRPISPDLEDPTLIHRERAEKLAKLQQLAAKKASRESLNQEPSSSAKVSLQKPTPIKPEPVKAKKPERKLQRKVSADSDSSLDLPLNQKILPRASAVLAPKVAPAPAASSAATSSPAPEDDGGSIFLKSLSALRDNCLSPAESESNIKEGRLLGALGISENAS
ncbi:unnamed protein product [Oikopleura dioica]|uniref:Uncharacterized protein n=1 Tax=Oikopleura dioica TaxID=34765 RepID=E4XPE9_OIKDI|nr:unnamed protein product [Oikopleura dioica]